MGKVRNLLLFGGADEQTFKSISNDITRDNQINLRVFSIISAVGMSIMLLASLFDDSLIKNRTWYIICASISVLILVLTCFCKANNKIIIYGCIYLFVGMLFAFGIALGTYIDPNNVSVSFPILLFAIPLLFTETPLRMGLSIIVGIISYIVVAFIFQPRLIFGYNMSNVLPYGAISLITSSYLMRIKIHRQVLEAQNKQLSESDQLTGMLNRRCYEKHISELRDKEDVKGITVCAFDVNGLKKVNDTTGHLAGDEIIYGAAQCIEKTFSAYGKCYRTGGDEFMAILEADAHVSEELRNSFDKQCALYEGSFGKGIAISTGIVSAGECDSIDDLIRLADKLMYEDKNRYYKENGIDRRNGGGLI